jgi:hypothetical protein
MWISSEVMNWFFGLFLFGFCFLLHLFVGEISPSFACMPVFVVRLSKRNASSVLLRLVLRFLFADGHQFQLDRNLMILPMSISLVSPSL